MSDNTTNLSERVWDFLSSPTGLAAMAGIAGGVLRWISEKEKPSEGFATMLAGALTAIFLGPAFTVLLSGWLDIPSDHPQLVAGVSFIVGIGGISIGALLVSLFRDAEIMRAIKDAFIYFLTRGGPKS